MGEVHGHRRHRARHVLLLPGLEQRRPRSAQRRADAGASPSTTSSIRRRRHDWEPLLVILDEANSPLADLLRFLIKLQKIWQDFVDGWNATIGPIVADIENLADGLTGGVLSEFGVVLDELKLALKLVAEEELLTFMDIFSASTPACRRGSAKSSSCGAT